MGVGRWPLSDNRDMRNLTIERILRECGMCDAHGFLVPAKNAASDGSTKARSKLNKDTLIEFTEALALPRHHAETLQLTSRSGDSKEGGQMLMKVPARSGEYALCVRYLPVGIGVDTEKWTIVVKDEHERLRRHQAILCALRDQLLSPMGAQTATMLPHLTGLVGAIVVRSSVGRAPVYSPLEDGFVSQLDAMARGSCQVLPFRVCGAFNTVMNDLIEKSVPCVPVPRRTSQIQNSPTKPRPIEAEVTMIESNGADAIWLAADYHFPSTYSIRVPMTSMSSAPGTASTRSSNVRLALIRIGIELFGIDFTRDELFPVIRSADVRIKPPERVAISTQLLRAYKARASELDGNTPLDESPVYRESCHAIGLMTVYLKIPAEAEDSFRALRWQSDTGDRQVHWPAARKLIMPSLRAVSLQCHLSLYNWLGQFSDSSRLLYLSSEGKGELGRSGAHPAFRQD